MLLQHAKVILQKNFLLRICNIALQHVMLQCCNNNAANFCAVYEFVNSVRSFN